MCDLCPEDTRPVYPSRETLWQAEIFEPFLNWVNDELAGAEAVFVSGNEGRGITWASLRESAR